MLDLKLQAEMKPNLFIVGAPKCGTTAWVEYLSSHPDIYFSPVKEPHYFCTDFVRYRAVRSEEEYLALFEDSGSARIVGEASVWYLYSEAAAAQIRQFNSEAKILVFVRNQRDFVPSLHNQTLYTGDENIRDFEHAWQLSGKRDESNTSRFCREPTFLDYKNAGQFDRHVERIFEHFPAGQVRIFHFDDWSHDPRPTYLEIMRFLGVADDGRNDFPPVNEAKQSRIRWLAPLIRTAPVKALRQLIARATGLRDLRVNAVLSRFNTRRGYATTVPEPLRKRIDEFYRSSNQRLEPRIWRPGRANPN